LEKVADGIEWAEGPLWDARDGSLLFSDVPRNLMWDELAASESLRAARASGEDLVESVVPMLDGAR
jgi:sugar lactone lactonase YvrE